METSPPKTATKITRKPQTRELVIERVLHAPRELVWEGWTTPEHIALWWGPKQWTTTIYKMDIRPGGVWHYCMRPCYAEGDEVWGRVVYEEVVEPSRLRYTEAFSDRDGSVVDSRERRTTVEFFESGDDATILIIRTQFATAEELESAEQMGMIDGYTMTLDRLQDQLSQGRYDAAH